MNAFSKSEINGLVLAGGKSTRLGQDKVALDISGRCLLDRAVYLLRKLVGTVHVSGRNPEELGVDAPWLPDETPGLGPMGGIITCLRTLKTPLLVMACDLPLMNVPTLETLLKAHKEKPDSAVMTTYLQMETGFIEALVAVYDPAALPHLEAARDQGIYKLSRAMPQALRHHIPYSLEQSEVFFNINYPADLALLERVQALCPE